MKEIKEFCTIREAARQSGLSTKAWYEGAAGTASVPRIRFGRSIRLLRQDVESFISTRIAEAELKLAKPEKERGNLEAREK